MKEINVKHGFKYRIYPTEEQKKYFDKAFAANRWWWNYQLEKIDKHYKETKEHLSGQYKIARELPQLKKEEETKWIAGVDAMSFIYTSQALDNAFKKFFKKQGGYPKFKARGYDDSYTIQVQKGRNVIDWHNNLVHIGKAGIVKTILHKKLNGAVKAITVSKKSFDYYEISILFDTTRVIADNKPIDSIDNVVGVDLGARDISNAILSDGYKFPTIDGKKYDKRLRRMKRRLDRMQRKVEKTYYSEKEGKEVTVIRPSNNYIKQKDKIAKLMNKTTRIRAYNTHHITSIIVNSDYGLVCAENLFVKGMTHNHHTARCITNANMGEIRRQLEYKCAWSGQEFVKVDRFYPSTKTCSCCGYINRKIKSDTTEWTCPKCGIHHDRDINAAINIRNEGYRIYSEGKQKK